MFVSTKAVNNTIMKDLNNRITKVQDFLEALRLLKKGKMHQNITDQFNKIGTEMLEWYPSEHILETIHTTTEV